MFYGCVLYGVCFLFSGSNVVVVYTNWSSAIWVCTIATLWKIPMTGIFCLLVVVYGLCRKALSSCSPHCFELGVLYVTNTAVPQTFSHYGWQYSCGDLSDSPIPLPSIHGGERISFPYLLPYPMTWSTPNLWWALKLVIPVWWLHIRLMNLLAPCWQNNSFLDHKFNLVHGQIVNYSPHPCELDFEDFTF